MKNKTLLRTNVIVCLVILLGFTLTSVISYRSNFGMYKKDIESVSTLSSEGIYSEIATIFSPPINVSLTMANDNLLKNFLSVEKENLTNASYTKEMQDYLGAYRQKYGYDSVFLVSTHSNRYYHFNGVDRILEEGDSENIWYYSFLNNEADYALNVDNDQATDSNTITVFVNCKIRNNEGVILGVVGVGFKVNSLQQLFRNYEEKYNLVSYLVDEDGTIEISSAKTGYEKVNLFDSAPYQEWKDEILSNEMTQDFWYSADALSGYVVSRYEPNLGWHLIVETDTAMVDDQLTHQLYRNMAIVVSIIILVLFTITTVIRTYNAQIIKLTISQEMEYQRLLHETTKGLYENIFEFDVTRNRAGGETTMQYMEALGLSRETPLDKALYSIGEKQLKPEHLQHYLDDFLPECVLEAYKNGITNLSDDFMVTDDGINYRWIRISARIFFWNSDQSVRMIAYRENIDEEKKREFALLEGIQRDAMTGFYNKRASEDLIAQKLLADPRQDYAFIMFDIDNFKTVNDTMGHSFGDHVIREFTAEVKAQFREEDILGRIGGDEFVVFMKSPDDLVSLRKKLDRLCERISQKDVGEEGENYYISCSIGIAMAPKDGDTYPKLFEKADHALYTTKRRGKNSYTFFSDKV